MAPTPPPPHLPDFIFASGVPHTHPAYVLFHEGHPSPPKSLEKAWNTVVSILYPRTNLPYPTPSFASLVLADTDGVASTTRSSITFSSDYAASKDLGDGSPKARAYEIMGVLVHEMVHVLQWDGTADKSGGSGGSHRAPGGLIEGIADYVRLKANLAPPHWRKAPSTQDWDAGYERTAYFLEWLEEQKGGQGFVVKLNQALKDDGWKGDEMVKEVAGDGWEGAWKRYQKSFEAHVRPEPAPAMPTHGVAPP